MKHKKLIIFLSVYFGVSFILSMVSFLLRNTDIVAVFLIISDLLLVLFINFRSQAGLKREFRYGKETPEVIELKKEDHEVKKLLFISLLAMSLLTITVWIVGYFL